MEGDRHGHLGTKQTAYIRLYAFRAALRGGSSFTGHLHSPLRAQQSWPLRTTHGRLRRQVSGPTPKPMPPGRRRKGGGPQTRRARLRPASSRLRLSPEDSTPPARGWGPPLTGESQLALLPLRAFLRRAGLPRCLAAGAQAREACVGVLSLGGRGVAPVLINAAMSRPRRAAMRQRPNC